MIVGNFAMAIMHASVRATEVVAEDEEINKSIKNNWHVLG